MINERQEELAALYALEALSPAEQAAFETALAGNPELRALVASLRATRDGLAGQVPPAEPPARLKQNLMAALTARETKTAPAPAMPDLGQLLRLWFPWALTAATAVFAICLSLENRALQQRADRLDQLAGILRQTTNSLAQTVASLQAANQADSLRIALLGSLLNDAPKAVAVSLWDNRRQSGVFVVQNLKPLPADRDYQLWVMDPQYPAPVSAGVFQVDPQGDVRIRFTATKTIATAGKFAVTMEPKGGLAAPTIKNLVLLGS